MATFFHKMLKFIFKYGIIKIDKESGMHDSKQQIILHAGYSLDTILECYNDEKVKTKK